MSGHPKWLDSQRDNERHAFSETQFASKIRKFWWSELCLWVPFYYTVYGSLGSMLMKNSLAKNPGSGKRPKSWRLNWLNLPFILIEVETMTLHSPEAPENGLVEYAPFLWGRAEPLVTREWRGLGGIHLKLSWSFWRFFLRGILYLFPRSFNSYNYNGTSTRSPIHYTKMYFVLKASSFCALLIPQNLRSQFSPWKGHLKPVYDFL